MTSLTQFLAFLSIAASLWSACRPSERSSVETVEFYVRYMKQEGQSLAEAVVRRRDERDSLYSIEVPGGMLYRNEPMRLLELAGTLTYRWAGTGTYVEHHPFRWSDALGRPREYTLTMPPVLDLSMGGKKLPLNRPATLRWHGPPIGEKETWVIIWEQAGQPAVVPMEIVCTPGSDRIEFPAAQLAKLGPGTWTYYVVRKKALYQESPSLVLKGVAEYYSDVDTVELLK